ncbi:hypothetical protein Hanom_Chr06g00529831 [Helianthus anomalus]
MDITRVVLPTLGTRILAYNHIYMLNSSYAITHISSLVIINFSLNPYTTSPNYADHAMTKIIMGAHEIIMVGT